MEENEYQDAFARKYEKKKGTLNEQYALKLRERYNRIIQKYKEKNQIAQAKKESIFDPLEGCTIDEKLKEKLKKQQEEQEKEM